MKKLLIVMVLGASAAAASAQGQETCSALQKGAAVVAAKSGDGEYVPGLQQGVFRNGRYNVNFSATCAEADSFSHTLGTILADVNQTRTSCQIRNELTGSLEKWPSWAAILYEGEMYFEGGREYNFFGCVDDLAACELDGTCFWCVGLLQINNLGVQVFSKKFEESGWHSIRVWLMDVGWDRGAVSGRVGFQGMGIGWNTNGCKVVNATTCLQWNRLLDDGSGRLLRSRVLPQKSARRDENGPMGTKEGDIRTFGVQDGLPFEIEMAWVDGCRDVDGFWVSKNRVTHRQWKYIMGYDPVDKNMQGEDTPIGQTCLGWGGDLLFLWGLNARYSGAGRFDRLSDAQWQLAAKYASISLPTETASFRLAFRPTDRRNSEREEQRQVKGDSDAAFAVKLANGEARRYSLAKGLDLDVIRVEGCGETFYLGRYEVTVEQYEKVMTSNPSIWSGAANLPVGSVDWTNATVFCEKLNALVPVEGMAWTLPTSKQWGFVANGGLKKRANTFFGGNNWQEVGWWGGDEFGHNYVRPVGLKKPNELGFHDLFGNCWEWCSDGDGRKDFRYLGGPGVGYAGGRRLVESFYSGRVKDAAGDWGLRVALVKSSELLKKAQEEKAVAANNRLRRPGLLGGSLRARRLQRQQEAQAAAAKQQTEVAAEKAQREAERAEQRRQLAAINEELKKVREQKSTLDAERQAQEELKKLAAAVRSNKVSAVANKISNTPKSVVNVVADKLQSCDFLLNKDFKKSAKFYLCLFSASWCPPCRREMPRIAKTYAEMLKDDPDIELIHFSRDQNDEKALAWAKEHDVKFPVVKPNGGNPLDLHSRGIPHLFIVKADGTLVEEGHPMRIFNEEKFRELKGGSIENATANGEEEGSKEHMPNESFVLTGPYGIRMTGRADCKKDAEYVLKKLVDVYLPCAVRYYGDPFGGKTPSRVFTIDVQRKDGSGKGGRAGHPWGYQDGKFNIGLVKDGDRWDLAKDYYLIMAFRILTVCEEADWAGLTLYAGDFVWGDIDHDDPIPRIKEDIRKGFELARTGEKVTGLLWATRRYAPMWAALEELREKHPTLLLDYCNLKNSKYAKGELPQKISADQMVALMGEVTGVDAAAIFKKHGAGEMTSR